LVRIVAGLLAVVVVGVVIGGATGATMLFAIAVCLRRSASQLYDADLQYMQWRHHRGKGKGTIFCGKISILSENFGVGNNAFGRWGRIYR